MAKELKNMIHSISAGLSESKSDLSPPPHTHTDTYTGDCAVAFEDICNLQLQQQAITAPLTSKQHTNAAFSGINL